METLSTAERIGVLGDTHGDMEHVLSVSTLMHARGVNVLLVLGDFGFIWPSTNWGTDLNKLNRRLAARNQKLYFVDGNHEDFARLYRHPVSDDGLRWLRTNVAHIPRGYRTVLAHARTLAALGGAASIDFGSRVLGQSWWPEETITEPDLVALGHQRADILIGHDAPLDLPNLDRWLADTSHGWPRSGLEHSRRGRQMFHRGFLQVRPRLYLGGHYHVHADETVQYQHPSGPFTTRVVILDKNGSRATTSQAILNTNTMVLEPLTLNGDPPRPIAAPTDRSADER